MARDSVPGEPSEIPLPSRRSRAVARLCFCIAVWIGLLGLTAHPIVAQQALPPTEAPLDDELTLPERVVEVEGTADDAAIAARLQGILQSTEHYRDLAVRVENGVVFLSGVTTSDDYREWARQLGLRTEDVVAVVNDLVVAEAPIWDFEPTLAEMRDLGRSMVQGLPMIAVALAILLVTVLVARLLLWVLRPGLERRVESAILRDVVTKTVTILVGLIGLYFFLRVSGLTSLALAILSGTGVVGLLIGFAFRDIAENFLASILISIQHPFSIGDVIEVDGHTGVVQKVTTRGTVLMAFDGNYIQIANATVYKNTIRNFTANPKVRLDFGVGVGYDASISEVQSTILDVLRAHVAILDDPEPTVLVEKLGPSTVDLRVYYWINSREHSVLKVGSAVIRQTLAALTVAGVPLPDEAREVIFPRGIPVVTMDRAERDQEASEFEKKAVTAARRERDSAATESEGDLASEVASLNAQARASDIPEEGQDLLSAQPGTGR